MTKHIADERLSGFISGAVELTGNEQAHMLNCQSCNDRFRAFLTSNQIHFETCLMNTLSSFLTVQQPKSLNSNLLKGALLNKPTKSNDPSLRAQTFSRCASCF